MKKNNGISMITLVITIIVIIILAAVAFGSSTRTIDEANFSNYVNDLSEVRTFFEKTSVQMHGSELLKNNPMRDEQIYNFVAKGGKTFEDFLLLSELPDYTIISGDADIGIKLPVITVESGTGKVIPIKYAATKEGKIFTWPPYDYEGKLYITDTDTVQEKINEDLIMEISVGDERFTIAIDESDGSLDDAPGIPVSSGGENGEEAPEEVTKYTITFEANGGSGSMSSIEVDKNSSYTLPSCTFTPAGNFEFESWEVNGVTKTVGDSITITDNTTITAIWKEREIATLGELIEQGEITQGTVIKYTPTSKSLKLGYDETGATNTEQTTELDSEWRVLYTDGGSALITTYAAVNELELSSEVGYKNGAAAITKLCKTLYSGQGLTARSLEIEDIEKATGIDTDSEIKAKYRYYKDMYAYYPNGTDLTKVTPPSGYTATAHSASYSNGFTEPRFYERDSGGIKSGDYWTPTATNPVCVTRTHYSYKPNLTSVINTNRSWLASPCVSLEREEAYASFAVRYVTGRSISSHCLRQSIGGAEESLLYGVRPAVELSSSTLIDTSNGYAIYSE